MNNQEFVKELLKVMEENPTLDVLCRVDSDIVAEDGYAWWLGQLNTRLGIDIDEYSDSIGTTIKFKSDEEYIEWFEELFDYEDFTDVPDNEWEEFCKKQIDPVANWHKAILVSVTTL